MSQARLLDGCDAVLFDAAGTLMHPHPSVGAVYAAAVAERGYAAHAAALEAAFRAAWRERKPLRFDADLRTSDAAERAWWRETVRRNFQLAGLAEPDAPCFEAIFTRFGQAQSWRLYPDVLPTLARLRQSGRRLALVSNFDSRIENICHGLGLPDALDAVVYSAAVGFAKPARPIFDAALEAVRTPASRALFVGDSPDDDIAGARAAGCRALLIDRDGQADAPVPSAA